jgi:hypothetical protein
MPPLILEAVFIGCPVRMLQQFGPVRFHVWKLLDKCVNHFARHRFVISDDVDIRGLQKVINESVKAFGWTHAQNLTPSREMMVYATQIQAATVFVAPPKIG